MNLRLSTWLERVRASFFFIPMLAVIVAAGCGFLTLAVDRSTDSAADLPIGFASTVESARALLGVIAGATISFAGIAFSVSLLVLQLASSQYSPRVIHTLFRDPFNKRVMGLVVGTFTYCVVVLRSVRSALEPGADPIIPNLSVALAVVLGVAAILAIIAFIDHNAHAMDISEILERIRRDATSQIRSEWSPAGDQVDDAQVPVVAADDDGSTIRFDRSGWVQQVDVEGLLACLPDGVTATVETAAGRYAIEHTRLCTLFPAVDDAAIDDVAEAVRARVVIGATRTMQQDVSYGLRQLVDVAVKALSPGINDPTTAQDAIFHTASVLSALLRHDPPARIRTEGSRTVVMAQQATHRELIEVAFGETRRAASGQPAVCIYLLAAINSIVESLEAAGLHERTIELRRQAQLVAEGCGRTDVLDDDLLLVQRTFEAHFGRTHPG